MIGHELGGRYEIIERVGGGGMALVYKAHDILLNRNVAVKVLRQQFVHDEEFIRRFRREAQSAASLSHPNVVSIYDVGQEDETHYIVMEYVEGSNLNEVILERAPLQADEAVRIALQICDALEHAHHNQIIHRDIKPHNILIGKNGRVKVTDFGIARAVTSSTITQTGSVVGSVHYFSPEHAKGVSTGEKSDLYSLGIVLYQMLTGRLPFLGESPISVALKHLQEDFEEPRAVNPHIPQSVENIILRSMRKNPAERYVSADEMQQDLETCLLPERLNEPKIEFGDEDPEATRVMPAIKGSGEVSPAVSGLAASAANISGGDTDDRWNSTGLAEPGKRKWVKPVVTVVVTLLILALLFLGFRLFLDYIDTDEVDVPYVVGMTEQEARGKLEEAGLKVEEPIIREIRDDVPIDVVFDQTKQNMTVKAGSFVKLYVSLGPQMEQMGNYVGQSYTDVRNSLITLGVSEDSITKEDVFSEQPSGTIISQTPANNEEFDPKTVEIHFTVSKGLETFEMPNLVGLTEKEAIQKIIDSQLTLGPGNGIVKEPGYSPTGQVTEQFPYKAGDPVAKGAEVSITVSSGLPEEALRYTFNISISPAVAGKSSEIRIVYSDARGENVECCKRTISDTQSFPVDVVLAPNTEARVTVYRDNEWVDMFSKTYDEVRSGDAGSSETIPGTQPQPPAEQPVQAEEPPNGPNGDEPVDHNPSSNNGGNNDEQQ
ncbi:Stk1 family PASTA domain-containing Ser/Thr kinase [Paenibacillus abyssi]|nr:Stk1 family PASTA domain-containing Ser/Thr kinase [Paenibacillus abyssi]